ncbi:MAG: molecular chaperone TorD family protein [Gammaproteobacteria bacterium]|nr:molecular chaperone TorD family protein [Gammaproteobacteria bacterium]
MPHCEAELTRRAEFYLCLARAFLPPRTDDDHRALAVYLADDLADLAGEIGYPISEPLAQLRAAFGALPEPLALLQLYSKLFLTPPAPVALNTGRYLDGAVMGGSVQAVADWYRRHGLERTESFHDLPDHVTLQLEFVARLFAGAAVAHRAGDDPEARRLEAEARAFFGAFAARWLPGFCAALERTHAKHRLPAPYLHLAHILCAAVECDTAVGAPRVVAAPATLTVTPIAANGPTPAQLQEIARALAAHGQSVEHLGVPLAARDAALGFARLTPPDLKRFQPD